MSLLQSRLRQLDGGIPIYIFRGLSRSFVGSRGFPAAKKRAGSNIVGKLKPRDRQDGEITVESL